VEAPFNYRQKLVCESTTALSARFFRSSEGQNAAFSGLRAELDDAIPSNTLQEIRRSRNEDR
jgi:hypothetical protein